jgi:hypothetical protein
MSERGQALIETALALPTVLIVVALTLSLTLMGFQRVALEDALYQSLLCCIQGSHLSCERLFHRQAQQLLPWLKIDSLRLFTGSSRCLAELRYFDHLTQRVQKKNFTLGHPRIGDFK